ncbi:MAG TPA: ester cyclase [Actinomycetota bacterium]|jgi:steroid delta-isomerase-like uncharacterized protein|nr:ester cyclase [Actinomycetota bacterium]
MSPSREEMMRETEAFYTAMNNHDVKDVTERVTEDIVDHQLPPGMPNGKDGVAAFFTMMFDAAPDMKFQILDTIISDDKIAIRSRVTGTQTGPFMQMQATGKPFDIEGIDIVTVDDDLKVTEHWGILDLAKMMQQVGAVPPPPM